jgi:hypothetical protein
LKRHRPALVIAGSGYSYLQEWLPYVAQAVVRSGGADFVGLGRLALSYPEMPADVLAGRPLDRKRPTACVKLSPGRFGLFDRGRLYELTCALRSRGPFLKELVKRKRCSFG